MKKHESKKEQKYHAKTLSELFARIRRGQEYVLVALQRSTWEEVQWAIDLAFTEEDKYMAKKETVKVPAIKEKTCPLRKDQVITVASKIANYLRLKRAVTIPIDQFEYNDDFLLTESNKVTIMASGFDYSRMITNYHQKQKVNEIFNRHFNFSGDSSVD